MPKPSSDRGGALQEGLQKLLGLRPTGSRITVTTFEDWNIDAFPHPDDSQHVQVLAIGIGEPKVVAFDDDMLQATLQWLASDQNAWLEPMRHAMGGPRLEITRPELLPDDDVIVDALYPLLQLVGDLGMSGPATVAGHDISAVDTLYMAYELAALRTALLIALGLQQVAEPSRFWSSIERQMESQQPGISSLLHQYFGNPTDAHFALARLWLIAGMSNLRLGSTLEVADPGGPVRIDPGPQTPRQLLWFTIALSAGAIVPPYPMPGVFQCAYHLCRKIFVSRKLGVGGKRRFCSVGHGKSFYAARRMKEKSKRNSPQPETED